MKRGMTALSEAKLVAMSKKGERSPIWGQKLTAGWSKYNEEILDNIKSNASWLIPIRDADKETYTLEEGTDWKS